ncbi:MAG: hypothetical protein DWH91_07570 [Planctomycetota bacterium]|nr:MAG: hypothetical protein DWH91_07570 [Planctomycetota bacterium]
MRVVILLMLIAAWTTESPAQSSRHFDAGIRATIPRHSPLIPQLNPPVPRIGDPFCHPHGRVYGPIYDPYLAAWGDNSWGPFGSVGWSHGLSYGPSLGAGYYRGYSYDAIGWNVYPLSPWGASPWSGPIVSMPQPATLQPLPAWMLDEAGLGQPEKLPPTARTEPSLRQPSTPEAQLRSARMQGIGDRFLKKRDFAAADKSYRSAIVSAPDRVDPYLRQALVKVARDDYRGAVTILREAVSVDPVFPARAETLDAILGPELHGLKVELKQKAADWTRVNIRDSDRLFLLGVLLFLDHDGRCHTLFDTAIKLSGEREHLMAFRQAELPAIAGAPLPELPLPPEAPLIAPEAVPENEPAPRVPLLVPAGLDPAELIPPGTSIPSEPTPVPDL